MLKRLLHTFAIVPLVFSVSAQAGIGERFQYVFSNVKNTLKEWSANYNMKMKLKASGVKISDAIADASDGKWHDALTIKPDPNGHRLNKVAQRVKTRMLGTQFVYSPVALKVDDKLASFQSGTWTVFLSDAAIEKQAITSHENHEIEHARLYKELYEGKPSDYHGYLLSRKGSISGLGVYSAYQSFQELSTFTLTLMGGIPSHDASAAEVSSYQGFLLTYAAILQQTRESLDKVTDLEQRKVETEMLRDKTIQKIMFKIDDANDTWLVLQLNTLPENKAELDALIEHWLFRLKYRVMLLENITETLQQALERGEYSELKQLAYKLRHTARASLCELFLLEAGT